MHELRDGAGFLDDVFDTPQSYVSLERTNYYVNEEARGALRITWAANTHAHESEVLVDATTLGIVEAQGLGSNIRDRSRRMVFFRGDSVTSVLVGETGETSSRTVPWAEERAFHLNMLPYWFAALETEPGERFVLPQFSSASGRTVIPAEVVGPAEDGWQRTDADRRLPPGDVWVYRSDHGSVVIEWYIDKVSPPYLRRAV